MALRLIERPLKPWGRLTLRFYQGGRLIRTDVEDNVVVKTGKIQWLSRLVNGTTATGVDRMEAGDGGCTADDPVHPIAFNSTDTDLRAPIGLSAAIQPGPVIDEGAQTITFVAVLAAALKSGHESDFHHGPPLVISELALKTAAPDNVTVALRAFESQIFDPLSAIVLEAEWVLGLV